MKVDDRAAALEVPNPHEVSRPGKISSCSTVVPGPRMSKRAKITDPSECTFPRVEVIRIARSQTRSK